MPAVRSPMPCGAPEHVGVWEHGAFVVDGLDRESEDVLAALGGTGCRCGDTEAAWDAAVDDLAVLTLAVRTGNDRAAVGLDDLGAAIERRLPAVRAWERHRKRSGLEGAGPDGPDDPVLDAWQRRARRLLLLTLSPDLQRRLVATVAHRASERWRSLSPVERARVTAAVTGRAAPYVRAALVGAGVLGAQDAPLVDIAVGPVGTEPQVEADGTSGDLRVGLTVDAGWLAGVWGRELTLRDGLLCVAVTDVTPDRAAGGLSVRWAGGPGNTRVESEVVQWENAGSPDGEPPTQE